MNKVFLIGRLTRDPEDKQTLVKYTLAVDSFIKDKDADFINCIAFGKTAEFARDHFIKGIKIAVIGRIQTGKYTNKDGQTVYTTDVVVESQEFCESKKKAEEQEYDAKDDLPPWLK